MGGSPGRVNAVAARQAKASEPESPAASFAALDEGCPPDHGAFNRHQITGLILAEQEGMRAALRPAAGTSQARSRSPAITKVISASATASPPSERSCAARTWPLTRSARTDERSPLLLLDARDRRAAARPRAGLADLAADRPTRPSQPVRRAEQEPRRSPARSKPGFGQFRRRRRTRPTPPMVGVGRMPLPIVSL